VLGDGDIGEQLDVVNGNSRVRTPSRPVTRQSLAGAKIVLQDRFLFTRVKTDFSITIGVIVSSRLCRFQLRWWHSVAGVKSEAVVAHASLLHHSQESDSIAVSSYKQS